MTAEERRLLVHALGGTGVYRNYFCAVPDSPNDRTWADLVHAGLAELQGTPSDWLPYNTYVVTTAGKAALTGDMSCQKKP